MPAWLLLKPGALACQGLGLAEMLKVNRVPCRNDVEACLQSKYSGLCLHTDVRKRNYSRLQAMQYTACKFDVQSSLT